MKTITMNSITLELNEKHASANRAALDELVRELKHNGGALFSASVSATDATFNIEPKEKEKAQYLVCFHHTTSDGQQEVLTAFFEPLGGKMTARAILAFELEQEHKHGRKYVAVRSWQEVDAE